MWHITIELSLTHYMFATDDTYNIPKGIDCTKELNKWVYCEDHHRLLNTPPRELPEYVRRFVQDVYMCVYIQPDVGMYF